MAIAERLLDMPTLRALRDAGGFGTTETLRARVQSEFTEPIGQWNVISNMLSGNSLISRGLVSRQVRYPDGRWIDFNDHLPRGGARPEERLALTEKGRLLLAGVSNTETMVPSNFEEIILAERAAATQDAAALLRDLVPRDEADTDSPPSENNIPKDPPKAPELGENCYDPEARAQANARRMTDHHALVLAVTEKAVAAHLDPKQTRYADALVRTESFGAIFEMKTIRKGSASDLIRQLRGAIAQLYHYRFIHRKLANFGHGVKLYAVFDATIPEELVAFLREIGIGTIQYIEGKFSGDTQTRRELPWLYS